MDYPNQKNKPSKKICSYLGERGYTIFQKNLSPKETQALQNDLFFTPNHIEGYGSPPPSFSILGKSTSKFFLPKFYGIEKFGLPEENKLDKHIKKINISFAGQLRKSQLEPYQTCMNAAKTTGGGILCLSCGSGKTVLAIKTICELGVKALVVVSKEFLMDQWKERIQEFSPDAKIGTIRQKKIDIQDKDIVIAMLQSVAMCDYDIKIFRDFGIVFYDEVHCVPSRVFSKSLRKIQTKYHFGLSATPNRVDGMTKVTKMFIGPVIYRINKKKSAKNPKDVRVIRVKLEHLPDNKFYKEKKNFRGKPDIIKMITNIICCPLRISLVAFFCNYLAKENRHILVLSERIQYLKDIHQHISSKEFDVGYYIGECNSKDRKKAESCNIILASYAMAKEAMDIPVLDTLIMATPKSNLGILEQCIGRILRKTEYPENLKPLVIDIVDDFSIFSRHQFKRKHFYHKSHYPVRDIVVKNNDLSNLKNLLENDDHFDKNFTSDIDDSDNHISDNLCNNNSDYISDKSNDNEQVKDVNISDINHFIYSQQ
jgi:superfamily II DNA or RNA helicase